MPPTTNDFEKLGAFYLGRRFNAETKQPTSELVLYDSKDLVTHALCVGMTGSGKTGLGIAVIEDPVRAFTGDAGGLRAITFESRPPLPRAAVFFTLGQHQASPLAEALGCRMNAKGTVDTARHESTNVPGLFVVGDASRNLQWVALAAAEGAEAAFAIVQDIIAERLR